MKHVEQARKTSVRKIAHAAGHAMQTLDRRILMCSTHDGLAETNGFGTFDAPASLGSANITPSLAVSLEIKNPISSLPLLHSKPSAAAKLFLDFDGDYVATWSFNSTTNLPYQPGAIPAYDVDGDPNTFEDSEIKNIRAIWSTVAEKFSPFNVDVTTQDPGNLDDYSTYKIDIGGTNAWYGSGGGVSQTGGFADAGSNIAFVWSAAAPTDINFVGAGAAHEAGHGFSLRHQGITDSNGVVTTEYSDGDGDTVPIMGNANNTPESRGIWFNGQANRRDQLKNLVALGLQDDISIVAGPINRFGFSGDDWSPAFPGSLTVAATTGVVTKTNADTDQYVSDGFIERVGDSDPWVFRASTNRASFRVDSAKYGGMLAPNAVIYRLSDNQIVSTDVTLTNTGVILNTSSLAANSQYVLQVFSQGGYGNLGGYNIRGNMQTFVSQDPGTGRLYVGGLSGNNNITLSFGTGVNPYFEVRDVVNGATSVQQFPLNSVSAVDVVLGSGNDTVSFGNLVRGAGYNIPIPVNVNTGTGADTLTISASNFSTFEVTGSTVTWTDANTAPYYDTIGGVETLNINGSADVDSMKVGSWPKGQVLHFYGGSGNDTLNIGYDVIGVTGSDIYFHGGAGNDAMTLNAYGRAATTKFAVLDGSVVVAPIGFVRKFHYDPDVETINLQGSTNDDLFWVDNLAATTTVNIYGDQGDDITYLGGSDDFYPEFYHTVSRNILGAVNIYGQSGLNDQIVIDDTAAPNDFPYYRINANNIQTYQSGVLTYGNDVEGITLNGSTTFASQYEVNGSSLFTKLNINAGSNTDIFIISGGSGPANLNGGAGNDYFQVGNSGHLVLPPATFLMDGGDNSASGDQLVFDDHLGSFISFNTLTDTTFGASYQNFESLRIELARFSNQVNVVSSNAATAVKIEGNAQNDLLIIGQSRNGNENTTAAVLGSITFDPGSGGNDTVRIYDQSSTVNTAWSFESGKITRSGINGAKGGPPSSPPIDFTLNYINASSVESTEVNAGAGDDELMILGNNRATTVTGGAGNDNFVIPRVSTINALNLNGGEGYDQIQATSGVIASTSGSNVTITNTRFDQFFGGGTAVDVVVDYAGMDYIQYAGADNFINRYTVKSTDIPLALFGGPLDDVFTVGNSNNSVEDIHAQVAVFPTAGNDELTINDQSATTDKVVHIGPYYIGGADGDSLFGAGGYVYAAGFAAVNLNLGAGNDRAYALPNTTAAINIDAGAGEDSLGLALASASNYAIDDHGDGSGSVTSDNTQPLSYASVEAVSSDDTAPNVIAGAFTYNPPAGSVPSVDVSFDEDVSYGLTISYLTITNTDTGESIPVYQTALQYDTDSNTAHFTFPDAYFPTHTLPDGNYSATIVAGVPDLVGNQSPAELTISFFTLSGDATRDRKVDTLDFNVLAANFAAEGATFADGDFTYDGTVDSLDFDTLVANYGVKLAEPAMKIQSRASDQRALTSTASIFQDGQQIGFGTSEIDELI